MMKDEAMLSVLSMCFAPVEEAEWKQASTGAAWSDFLDAARCAMQDDRAFGETPSPIANARRRCPLQEFLSVGEVNALFSYVPGKAGVRGSAFRWRASRVGFARRVFVPTLDQRGRIFAVLAQYGWIVLGGFGAVHARSHRALGLSGAAGVFGVSRSSSP